MKRTLILGLGNPILTDDGVGVRVAEELRARLPRDAAVEIAELSVGGLILMESMIGYERVILIDAFLDPDGIPGAYRKMDLEDLKGLSPTQHTASPHDASLVTAIEVGQRLGLPLPDEVEIFAIQVQNVMDFGDQPTPGTAEAIPLVAQAIVEELEQTAGPVQSRR